MLKHFKIHKIRILNLWFNLPPHETDQMRATVMSPGMVMAS